MISMSVHYPEPEHVLIPIAPETICPNCGDAYKNHEERCRYRQLVGGKIVACMTKVKVRVTHGYWQYCKEHREVVE